MKVGVGICRNGKGLREIIEERDNLFEKTGYCWGLEKLELLESDPGKFERFQSRLLAAAHTARETSKWVSTSPTVVGMAELLDMIALPDGDVVATSWGLMGHVTSPRQIIKEMARENFEENPGIREGDIFFCNDPWYGLPHPSDMYTLLPVFYKGELVAWAIALNHVMDSGAAICPGGVPSHSPTTYTDGFIVPPTKTGENFTQFKWWELQLQRRTRMGLFNVLDDKMRVVGAVMLHNRILEIIEEFGIDYFERGLKEILERERRAIQNRILLQGIPGKYSIVNYHLLWQKDILSGAFPAAEDHLLHYWTDIEVMPQGNIVYDLEGTSSQGLHALNCTEGCRKFGYVIYTFPLLIQSPFMTTGLLYVLTDKVPPGTMVSATRSDLGMALALVHGTAIQDAANHFIAQSWFARGFLEEAYPMDQTFQVWAAEGVFANGIPWAAGDFTFAGSEPLPATAWCDGSPHHVGPGNPQGDFGEAEEWEFIQPPFLIIGRKQVPDYLCHGKYRGPVGGGIGHLICEPGGTLSFTNYMGLVRGRVGSHLLGMLGGYPTYCGYTLILHDTNAWELVKKGIPLPRDFVEAHQYLEQGVLKAGKVKAVTDDVPPTLLANGDLIYQATQAADSWGEPLDRDPELARRDLEEGWVTSEVVRGVYGVVASLSDGKWVVDKETTAKARQAIREKRRERAVSVKEWWMQERQRVLNKDFPELTAKMYRDILQYQKFRRHFTGLWQTGEDYQI